ncbi:chemosensory receptor B [Elysia marginata]|uniref:Chemosensory receptor B n=1 Tax=Elysia marginata TaxID=1093978 RepID=A0AAV4EE32_9GAST|nr:chemosensory receptor B [Elysia marginata]
MENSNVRNSEGSYNFSPSSDVSADRVVSSTYDIPAWFYSLLMEYLSYAMIGVSVFGMTSNILIIVIYVKIGFSESINISYCALGISDTLYVIFVTWNAICFIPAFARLNLPFIPSQVVVPTGGANSDIFLKTTAWITAWISVERCLCVMFPFKVRTFVTRGKTLFAIITMSFFIVVPLTGLNFAFYAFEFTYDFERNRTILKLFHRNSTLINRINDVYFIYKTLLLNFLPLLVVLLCAVFLATRLKASAAWRLQHSGPRPTKNASPPTEDKTAKRKYDKDMRIAKTVLLIAVTFILLGALNVQRLLLAMIWQEFRPFRSYGKWYRLTSRIALFLLQANSSVNFIIYYHMGAKFRQTANQMFCSAKRRKRGVD